MNIYHLIAPIQTPNAINTRRLRFYTCFLLKQTMDTSVGTISPRFHDFQVSILPRPNQLTLCKDPFRRFNTQCLNETNPQQLRLRQP